MRQAIRVYAIVALVVSLVFLVVMASSPAPVNGYRVWTAAQTLILAAGLWTLLSIPLGVLAASDAARAGRRGWLALFVSLLILAPFVVRIGFLAQSVRDVVAAASCGTGACAAASWQPPAFLDLATWIAGFLVIPLVALVYAILPARSATDSPMEVGATRGERRALMLTAGAGAIVMSALGYVANSLLLPLQVATWLSGSPNSFAAGSDTRFTQLASIQALDQAIWVTLAALPVAVAALAMAHAARTARRGWVVGWAALAVVALLAANQVSVVFGALIAITPVTPGGSSVSIGFEPQLQLISVAVPVAIMLLAFVYALTVMRPGEQRAVAVAVA